MLGLKEYTMMVVAGSVIALGGYSYHITKRNWSLKQERAELQQYIKDVEAGAALAEDLRKENFRLRELNAIALKELSDVEDYATDLSPALSRILERVQSETQSSGWSPK